MRQDMGDYATANSWYTVLTTSDQSIEKGIARSKPKSAGLKKGDITYKNTTRAYAVFTPEEYESVKKFGYLKNEYSNVIYEYICFPAEDLKKDFRTPSTVQTKKYSIYMGISVLRKLEIVSKETGISIAELCRNALINMVENIKCQNCGT